MAAVHGVTKSQTRLSDFTFTFHFSLSYIGEGNGNLLQCSCLENPRDRGAWWAAVYGVAQNQTRLKRLSSSSSSRKESRPENQAPEESSVPYRGDEEEQMHALSLPSLPLSSAFVIMKGDYSI